MQRLVLYPISFICGFRPEFQVRVTDQPFPNKCIDGLVSHAVLWFCALSSAGKTLGTAEDNSSFILWSFKVQYSSISLGRLLSFRAGEYVARGGEEGSQVPRVEHRTFVVRFWHPTVGNEFEEQKSQGEDPSLSWVQQVTCTLGRCGVI